MSSIYGRTQYTALFLVASSLSVLAADRSALHGRVSDLAGQPLQGVLVTASSVSGEHLEQSLQTDVRGEYSFPELPDGVYAITAKLDGFVSISLQPIRIYYPVQTKRDFRLEVADLGTEGGIFTHSAVVGELKSGSTRVASAKICLLRMAISAEPVCTTTNRLGQYFLLVAPGVYDVTIEPSGGAASWKRLDLTVPGEYRNKL